MKPDIDSKISVKFLDKKFRKANYRSISQNANPLPQNLTAQQ